MKTGNSKTLSEALNHIVLVTSVDKVFLTAYLKPIETKTGQLLAQIQAPVTELKDDAIQIRAYLETAAKQANVAATQVSTQVNRIGQVDEFRDVAINNLRNSRFDTGVF